MRSARVARKPMRTRALLALAVIVPAGLASAERRVSIDEAIALARERNPSLGVAEAELALATAERRTASQYRNPSVAGLGGQLLERDTDLNEGQVYVVGVSQPIESPFLRGARNRAADAGIEAARAAARLADAALVARVKREFVGVTLATGRLALSEEQRDLLTRVRAGIERTVEVGEGAGVDLARAETEVLNVRRQVAAARVALVEAELRLATAIGEPGGARVTVSGDLPPLVPPPRPELRARVLERSPAITRARSELERAEREVELERQRRLGAVDLEAEWEREPDTDRVVVGVRVPLPLWNRRGGQIAEAQARARRARAALAQAEFAVTRALDRAYNDFQLASEQVELIEDGLLEEGRRALRGAEAAYRSGERGILEYLDSQRTLRRIRFDLLDARGAMLGAAIELERLTGETF